MSNTIYGNIITSGNYNIRCYCIYNDAVVGDTEVSIEILEVGFKRGGNSLSLNMANCYCTSNADDYTEVKKTTSGTWSTTTGTKAVITDDRTFTWERTNVEQTKTVTLTSVKPSGTLGGTSTITIEVVIPPVGPPPPPEPDPEWIEPVTNRTIGSRTNYNDMNRITNNLLFMGVKANKIIYSDGDFVTDKEWKRIVDICKLADGTITQSTSYTNLNKIEAAIEHIPQYLRFKAVDNTDIALSVVGTMSNEPTFYYSTDYLTWDEYTLGDTISLDEGERCYFKGLNEIDATPANHIQFSSTGRVQGGGNVMSLVFEDAIDNENIETYNLTRLFYNCTTLLTAPDVKVRSADYQMCRQMFAGCTGLTAAPKLEGSFGADYCLYSTFNGCTNIVTPPPTLYANKLFSQAWGYMFHGCTSLETPPQIAIDEINMSNNQHAGRMFKGCTALTTLPKLDTLNVGKRCYEEMFDGCSSVKVSTTQTEECPYEFRIPANGTGTDLPDDSGLTDMFANTGGTFTGTPAVNTTYYTNNEPI